MNMNTVERTNLESEIISTIKAIPKAIERGTCLARWTATLKRALIDLGKKNNYRVCAAGFLPDDCDIEWLYDLVWFRNDPPEHLREIGLVLESEWSKVPFDIKYDFEKLLVAKSPIKVMVFQDYQENLPQMLSLLETGIRCFRAEPANESYIFAGFRNSEYAFEFKTIRA